MMGKLQSDSKMCLHQEQQSSYLSHTFMINACKYVYKYVYKYVNTFFTSLHFFIYGTESLPNEASFVIHCPFSDGWYKGLVMF